jgi:hypothetical protein
MQSPSNITVVYHYFEADSTYKDNLIYFLSTAIFKDIDYYIIISGNCTAKLPESNNIKYIYTPNKNNDYGGYVEFFKKTTQEYDYYIFVNSSTRGPFLPAYYSGRWVNPFIEKLIGNTQLVGGSVNLLSEFSHYSKALDSTRKYKPPYHHIQTTAFAMTKQAKNYLVKIGFFGNESKMIKNEVIQNYEIGLSTEILNNGWDISTIQSIYANFNNYNTNDLPKNHSCKHGDTLQKNNFFSRTLTPFDLIFIKTNRDLLTDTELASYTFAGLIDCKNKQQNTESDDLKYRCEIKIIGFAKKQRWIKKFRKFFKLG